MILQLTEERVQYRIDTRQTQSCRTRSKPPERLTGETSPLLA